MKEWFRKVVILFVLVISGQAHAQSNYFTACIEGSPTGYMICRLKPDGFKSWLYDSGYGIAPRDAVGGYFTEDKAIQETMNYLVYSNPNYPNMCNVSYSVGELKTLSVDGFILSNEPIRQSRVLYITYGWRSNGQCTQISTGAYTIYANRGITCKHAWSGTLGYWATDLKSYMCVSPASETPPPCDMCSSLLQGNPLLVPTREKVDSIVDLEDSGPMPLEFRRTYRSHRARDKSLWFMGYYENSTIGSLGDGWVHNHDISLGVARKVVSETITLEQVRIQMGDGTFHYFYRDGSTPRYTARNSLHVLIKEPLGWSFEDKEADVTYVFNTRGGIKKQIRRNGWELTYQSEDDGRIISVANQFGRSLSFVYDANKKLVRVKSSDQREIFLEHVGDILDRVVQADGTSRRYVYTAVNGASLLAGIVDENNIRYSTYAYDSAGWAASTQKAGGVERYQLTQKDGIVDPLNTFRSYRYKLYGNTPVYLGASIAPAFSDEFPLYSGTVRTDGLVASHQDQISNQITYSWDDVRRLPLSVTEATGRPETRTTQTIWHSQWRLPIKRVEQGRVTEYTYDSLGNPLTQAVTDVATNVVRTTIWAYHPSGLLAAETAPNGATTSYQYDNLGNLIAATNALGHIDAYTYDGAGRVLAHTAPNGLKTTYAYDARGRVLAINRGGENTVFTYRPSGQVVTVALPHGHGITYIYDDAQRVTGWTDNRGNSGSYVLDAMGNRISEEVRNAQGQLAWQLVRTINTINRVASITQGGQKTTYNYDSNGDLYSSVNGLGQSTSHKLDALRRVQTLTNAAYATAQLSYNAQDAITQAKDFKGVTTTYGRDAQGNATSEISPDSGTEITQYDALGLPRTLTDALGQATTIERDLLGRPTQITHPDGTTTTLRYDQGAVGYLSSITDPSGSTSYERDSLGRVLRKTQTLVSGNTRSIAYQYDAGGQLASTTYPDGRTLQYQRDTTGQITALIWAGQPIVQGITWTPLGQPQSWQWTLPGAAIGLPGSRSYNSAGQTTATETTSVQYDVAGRIQGLSQNLWHPADTNPGQGTLAQTPTIWNASYDSAGRLTSLTKTSGSGSAQDSTTYQYDANGNLTSSKRQRAGQTVTRTYRTEAGHNKLLGFQQTTTSAAGSASTSVTHQYDAAGNLQTDGLRQYHYDSQGRLQSASTGQGEDAPTTRYAHNALGQRVYKTEPLYTTQSAKDDGGALGDEEAPGLIERIVQFFTRLWSPKSNDAEKLGWAYAYDEDGSLLGEYGMGGAASAGQSQFLYLPTASGPLPIAADIDGSAYAIHTDHLGTPRRLTQADGQAAWQWAYTPYGDEAPTLGAKRFTSEATTPTTGSTSIPPVRFNLRYPGQYFDEESGLHYNYFRSYNPATGRYTQADPIRLEGGWNRFLYVGGNPLSRSDPLGLTSINFDPINGILTVDPETEGRGPYSMPASSGRPGCGCSPSNKDTGPIPSGIYVIDASQVSKPGLVGRLARNMRGDWGNWRVPLTPNEGTPTFNRSGFFLHGGSYPGSAGCIDFGGGLSGNSQTNQLLQDIISDPDGKVPITVEWPSFRISP